MIALYILAWLLCGFAGAYIGHRWADKGRYNTTLDTVVWITIFGPITLIGASLAALAGSVDSDKVVFKRKS